MKVVPLQRISAKTEPSVPPEEKPRDRSVAARWSDRLAQFTPIPLFFLKNYAKIGAADGQTGLNPSEAMVIIQLMSFKWDERAPFPTVGKIAEQTNLKERSIREIIRRLEGLGLIRREPSPHGGPNRYHFEGLVSTLHRMMDEQAEARDAKEEG